MNGNNVVLIPALNPSETLIDYVQELISAGFERIVVVDDGSAAENQYIFSELEDNDQVFLLHHAKNYGKGRALKNGFNFILNRWKDDPSMRGIITADSDGQHLAEDVLRLSDALDRAEIETLFLGSRSFDYDFVPFKSKFGNKLTSGVFRLLYGKKIRDTQTGLRAISKEIVWNYLDLSGERFEYEINMLIDAARRHTCVKELPIKTVYINQNSETHFDPIRDSWRIYKVIFSNFFRYVISSLSSSLLDLAAFQLFVLLLSFLTAFMIAFGLVRDMGIRLLILTVGLLIGIVSPILFLRSKTEKRRTQIQHQLPEVMDILMVSVEAGLGLDEAISQMAGKMKGVIVDEFQMVLRETQMGKPRKEAFARLAECADIQELKVFVSAVIQAEQLGIPIKNVLAVQSASMRDMRRQIAQEKGMKAPVKMIIPMVVFILPVLIIILMAPVAIQLMEQFK